MSRRALAVVVAAVVAFSGAASIQAGAAGVVPGTPAGSCLAWKMPDAGGRYVIALPDFCQGKICEVLVGWQGASVGPLRPGLSLEVNFIQWGDGNWQAGPAASVSGVNLGQGTGRNGNGVSEAVFGPFQARSSYIELRDDLGPENARLRLTFQLHQGNPASPDFTAVTLFLCPG